MEYKRGKPKGHQADELLLCAQAMCLEKLRPCMADRFVLTLINNRMVSASDFEQTQSGAVFLKDEARRTFLRAWQSKKQEEITRPYLKEKLRSIMDEERDSLRFYYLGDRY